MVHHPRTGKGKELNLPHQQCKVCASPLRDEIDRALQEGSPSLRELARQTGLSHHSLFRHSRHGVQGKPRSTSKIREEIGKLRAAQTAAKKRRDTKAVIALSREIRAWTQLEARTRAVVPSEPASVEEMSPTQARSLAQAVIEAQLGDQDVRQWILALADRIREQGNAD
jgi:hypothetical protein